MEQRDPVQPVAGFPLMDMAAQRIRIVAADGIEQAREAGDVVFHLLFAGVLQAQEFGLDFADVPGLFGELQAEQPHIAFEDADEGAEAFVAAVARQLVGDGREPESQRNVAVGKDAHALKGQGESAVQAAFRASGGVQVAFAPGDQETQRAFHADDAARSLLARSSPMASAMAVQSSRAMSGAPSRARAWVRLPGGAFRMRRRTNSSRTASGRPGQTHASGASVWATNPAPRSGSRREAMASCGFPPARRVPASGVGVRRRAGRWRGWLGEDSESGAWIPPKAGEGGASVCGIWRMVSGRNRIWSYRDIRWE